jgi:hypothetical protein
VSQTPEGAFKHAASRLGMTLAAYKERATAEKWCTGCKKWHPKGDFLKDVSRSDGLASTCRKGRKTRYRRTYKSRPRPLPGRSFVDPRDGDKKQARRRANHLVDVGVLPRPDSLPCADCGHVCSTGGRRHEYDHYLGYGATHHEDVEAVCTTCHKTRTDVRGENPHKRRRDNG